MRSRQYLEGPFRGAPRSALSPLAQEAVYAFGGLALVVYLLYAFVAG